MDMSKLNYLAILVSALSSFLIGGLWYSGAMFGKAWMKENGFGEEDLKQSNMGKVFGISFLLSLVIALNLAMFLGEKADITFGIFAGFMAGFGWVAMSFGVVYLFERRSLKLWLINSGYHVITFTLMGAILGVWK